MACRFKIFTTFILLMLVTGRTLFAQDTAKVSPRYLDAVNGQVTSLQHQLDKKSQKALAKWERQEAKMRSRLEKIDSSKAKQIFGTAKDKLQQFSNKNSYIPSLDTLAGSIGFLSSNPQLFANAKDVTKKLKAVTGKVSALKDEFKKAASLQQYLNERREYLKGQLSQFGFARQLKSLNKQAYYYAQQVTEYKQLLKDHKKAERKAIELLSKTKLFKDFMRKNSQLASLFRIPDPDNPATMASLAGLQTRAQVNSLIQQQIGSGGPNAQAQVSQNIQSAQSQLNELKNKMLKLGSSSSELTMPEGFKPNEQKTKSFWKRLEYGSNLQTQKATYFFPTTTDLGLSVGYKLNDRSVIGIGASYKAGLGRGWNHIRFTSEGMGLRSFVDWKIKGSFWLSGGYEQNYRTAFSAIAQLKDQSAWQQSGLVGVSKLISLKTKFFKNTKLQLLWDMLSYRQVPQTQPVVFRVGYSF